MRANYKDKVHRRKLRPMVNHYLHKRWLNPVEVEEDRPCEDEDTTVKNDYKEEDLIGLMDELSYTLNESTSTEIIDENKGKKYPL